MNKWKRTAEKVSLRRFSQSHKGTVWPVAREVVLAKFPPQMHNLHFNNSKCF